MSAITLSQVKTWALAEIEKEGPEYIYKADERDNEGFASCYYYEDSAPSCLVGRILDTNGLFSVEKSMEVNEEDNSFNELLADDLFDELGLDLTPEARRFLAHLQAGQDGGKTWSEAYHRASSLISGYSS